MSKQTAHTVHDQNCAQRRKFNLQTPTADFWEITAALMGSKRDIPALLVSTLLPRLNGVKSVLLQPFFGGRSTATRNKRVAQLMDKGFKLAPSRVAVQKPTRPDYSITSTDTGSRLAGKTVRVKTNRPYSPRPKLRPAAQIQLATTDLKSGIESALSEAQNVRIEVEQSPAEKATPISVNIATIDTTSAIAESLGPTVVSRLSTSNGGHWGINVGRFNTRYAAEKMLLKTALAEIDALDGSLRKVHQSRQGFEATFLGLSEARALQACTRLSARNIKCSTISPG